MVEASGSVFMVDSLWVFLTSIVLVCLNYVLPCYPLVKYGEHKNLGASSPTELRKPFGSLIRGDTIGLRCRASKRYAFIRRPVTEFQARPPVPRGRP